MSVQSSRVSSQVDLSAKPTPATSPRASTTCLEQPRSSCDTLSPKNSEFLKKVKGRLTLFFDPFDYYDAAHHDLAKLSGTWDEARFAELRHRDVYFRGDEEEFNARRLGYLRECYNGVVMSGRGVDGGEVSWASVGKLLKERVKRALEKEERDEEDVAWR